MHEDDVECDSGESSYDKSVEIKLKPKLKEQESAEQSRQEMEAIADEIAEQVKQEEDRVEKKKAELEIQKRLEECARQATEEKKLRENKAGKKQEEAAEYSEREEGEHQKELKEVEGESFKEVGNSKQKDSKKSALRTQKTADLKIKEEEEKKKQAAATKQKVQQAAQRSYPPRELPPRFAHKQQQQKQQNMQPVTQAQPKKAPGGARQLASQVGSSLWDAGSEPEGVWSQGKTSGSGWTNSEAAPQAGDSQEIGTWRNPEGMWGPHTANSTNDIIVDTQDKEAWPSIGDQSETASDAGDTDNASVKSGSVISSSSNPGQPSGQGQGQSDSTGQGSSAIKGQSASTVWGANYNPGEEKMESSAAWGISPQGPAVQINSGPWANASPQNSAVNNHGPNMQSNQSASSGGDNASNPLTSNAPGNPGMGWGITTAGVGSNNGPQDCMQAGKGNGDGFHSLLTTGGAQTANNGPHLGGMPPSSTASNAMSWPGINLPSAGIPGLQKEQAANQDAAWSNKSAGNSVIGSGLSISSSTAGPNSIIDSKCRTDQWGSPSGNVLGWGRASTPPGKPEATGWGSPNASPIPNAGTEGWGQPEAKPIPQAWMAQNQHPQYSKTHPSGGWGQQDKPNSAGWGQPDAKYNAPGWGDPNSKPSPSGWDMSDSKSNKSVWGQFSDGRTNPQSQWGAGAGAANPPQWGGNNNGAGAAGGNPPGGENPAAAWGGSSVDRGNGRPGGPPGPLPPGQQGYSNSSWGQSGKELGHPSQPPSPSMSSTVISGSHYSDNPKDQMILEAINSQEEWGKRPIRQDTTWDVDNSPQTRRKSLSSDDQSSHWNHNNNGTAIWESSKDSAPPSQQAQWAEERDRERSRGASRGGAEWGSDNDSGTWNGPPDHNASNTWNGPPPNTNWGGGPQGGPPGGPQGGPPGGLQGGPPGGHPGHQGHQGHQGGYQGNNQSNTWGGANDNRRDSHWGGGNNGHPGHPGNHWGGKRDDNQWAASKDDNMWDKNGTNAWGQGGGGGGGGGGAHGMETGTWGDPHQRRRNSSSSWGDRDDMDPMGWDDSNPQASRRVGGDVDDGTAFWGNPQSHPKPPTNWERHQGPPNTSMPPPHMQPPMGPGPRGPPPDDKTPGVWGQSRPPSNKPGWCDGSPDTGIDNGTSIWGQGTQQVRDRNPKQGGWNDQQWPGGGMKSKPPTSGWGPDTGEWNQPIAKKLNTIPGANLGVGGKQHQPQMRSKLLQQLTEMGFKREDAQNALISNNMNLESAIADLVSGANKRHDLDMDIDGQKPSRKVRGMSTGDLPDSQSDANQYVPPMSMQNTPFSNAQPQLPSPQVLGTGLKGAPVNLGSLNASSLSPSVQQKLVQQQQHQQLAHLQQAIPQAQPIRGSHGQLAGPVQQQIVQQQIVQQLRMAVQAGLISPQLLNQQLTPNLQVLLRQLLQLQEANHRLASQKQVLQTQVLQQKNPVAKHQLEQVTLMIPKINTQIYQLQQQIQHSQQSLAKQVPLDPSQGKADLLKDLTSNITTLTISAKDPQVILQQQQHQHASQQHAAQQQQQQHPHQQSRLVNQWKLPSPDKESTHETSLNKAVGTKPIIQSHSTPNLQSKLEPGAPLPFSDSTWSSLSTSASSRDWPSASAISSGVTTTLSSTSKDNESKESPATRSSSASPSTAATATTNTSNSAISTNATVTSNSNNANTSTNNSSSTTTSTTTTNGNPPNVNITDMIEEFVPGKPWTGITTKSVEDDPYLTPASVNRPSLSVNTIKDEYLTTALGKSSSSPSMNHDSGSSLGSGPWAFGPISSSGGKNGGSGGGKSTWSSSSGDGQGSLASELWGVPSGTKNTRPPPGLTNQNRVTGSATTGFNRSVSWAPGDNRSSSYMNAGSTWGGQTVSNCLVLKNLTPQIDGSTLRTLCMQHGPLQAFYLNLNAGQAFVRYSAKEEANKAQKSLNTCVLGNTTILAEFVSENEGARLFEQLNHQQAPPPAAPGPMPSPMSGSLSTLWSHAPQQHTPPQFNFQRSSSHYPQSGFGGGGNGMWGSGGGLWGANSLDDHHLLQGDVLGGQHM